jgi:DNA-binding NarL/FixJ family response regulator
VELASKHVPEARNAHSGVLSTILAGDPAADRLTIVPPGLYPATRAPATVIIDHRVLMRECLHRGLLGAQMKGSVDVFDSVEALLQAEAVAERATLIVLSMGDRSPADLKRDWTRIVATLGREIPVVLLAEEEKASFIIEALDDGIRGYIPTSVPLGVAVEALELVRAGGTFIPARSFLHEANRPAAGSDDRAAGRTQFTGRQAEVVNALRKGTSNKIIAHELRMAESTVKVHVRNIMRKLKARNRTHVAFLLNELDATHW